MARELDAIDKKALIGLENILDRCLDALSNSGSQNVSGILATIENVVDRKNMIEKGYFKMRAPEADPDFDMTEPPRETSQLSQGMLNKFRRKPDMIPDTKDES